MNNESHPDTDLLKAYVLDSESPGYAAVRLHLAQCGSCRDEVDSISTLLSHHDCVAIDEPGQVLDEDDHLGIMDYVDGKLAAHEHERIAALIRTNNAAMKAALHYAGHKDAPVEASRDSVLQGASAKRLEAAHEGHFTERLAGWLGFRAPLWASVATTAIAVLALVAIVPVIDRPAGTGATAGYIVASYQDNPEIQFRTKDVLPGIGFFSKAEQFSTAYNNVEVAIQDAGSSSKLMLKWPGVERAVSYTMRLQMFEQGLKKTIGEITTRQTSGVFGIETPGLNRRYEWVLSGTTDDEKTFYATGGFVISRAK